MPAKKKAPKTVDPTPELDATITEWFQLSKWLAQAKVRELELRNMIAKTFQPEAESGALRFDYRGCEFLLSFPENYTVDAAALPDVLEQLPEGKEDVLIRWKPELNVTNYKNGKKLNKTHRAIFDEVLTLKFGTPALSVVPVGGGE